MRVELRVSFLVGVVLVGVVLGAVVLGGAGRVAAQEGEGVWVRPRLGMSFTGGGTLGEPEGWLAGGNVRAGVQIGDWFGTYYQLSAMYAALDQGTEIESGGDSDNALVLWNAFLFEATLFDVLSLAAGPSADLYLDCEDAVQAHRGCARDAVFFGVHGRLALGFGGREPGGKRHALSIAFEVHPTFFTEDHRTVSMLGAIGVDLY